MVTPEGWSPAVASLHPVVYCSFAYIPATEVHRHDVFSVCCIGCCCDERTLSSTVGNLTSRVLHGHRLHSLLADTLCCLLFARFTTTRLNVMPLSSSPRPPFGDTFAPKFRCAVGRPTLAAVGLLALLTAAAGCLSGGSRCTCQWLYHRKCVNGCTTVSTVT